MGKTKKRAIMVYEGILARLHLENEEQREQSAAALGAVGSILGKNTDDIILDISTALATAGKKKALKTEDGND